MAGFVRQIKINGKTFTHEASGKNKKDMLAKAEQLRGRKYKFVRVRKEGNSYVIWARDPIYR